MEKAAITIREFCSRYSISRTTLHKLRTQGDGPAICRVGGRVLIPLDAAEDWFQRHREKRAA